MKVTREKPYKNEKTSLEMGKFPKEHPTEVFGRTLGEQMKDELMKNKIWIINKSMNLGIH